MDKRDPRFIKIKWDTPFLGQVRRLVRDLEDAGYDVDFKERPLGFFSKRQEVIIYNTGNKKLAYAMLTLAKSELARLKEDEIDWAVHQLDSEDLIKVYQPFEFQDG